MEVMISSNYDSACTTPYLSAPSSPQRIASFFYSAPASPTRVSAFYHGGAVPFDWEEKPGVPKSHLSTAASSNYGDAEDEALLDDADFAFDFSGYLEKDSLPADELFDGGKIRPLKPPPRFQYDPNRALDSPKSPKSPKKLIREAFSPRNRPVPDPFTAALEQTRKESSIELEKGRSRGRERNIGPSTSSNARNKSSRSLSPFRVSDLLFDPVSNQEDPKSQSTSSFSSFWYKKWKIKDLLLFRSASESRAKDKEQQLKKTRQEDVKNSSFRSTDSVGSGSSRRRPGAPISAHELHYTVNRGFFSEWSLFSSPGNNSTGRCTTYAVPSLGFSSTTPLHGWIRGGYLDAFTIGQGFLIQAACSLFLFGFWFSFLVFWFYKKRGTRSNARRSAESETETPFWILDSPTFRLYFLTLSAYRGFPEHALYNQHLDPGGILPTLASTLSLALLPTYE